MKLAVTAGEHHTFATSTDDSASLFNGEPEAMFEFSVSPESAASYLYQGLYPASAAVASDNKNPANYKVNLHSTQNATAASYDPSAYILVAKPQSFDQVETDWAADFLRATALNKITLKNVPSGKSINRVKITAPSGKYLAGGRHINLSANVKEDILGDIYSGDVSVEVKYETPLTGTNVDVWFTSWGVELSAGETLTIIAYTTDHKSYTKTITLTGEQKIYFEAGYLNTLGANLSGITPEDAVELGEGDYVVLAKKTTTPVAYHALKAELSGTRVASVEYTGDLDINDGSDADIVWHVTKSGNSYIFANNNKYLGSDEAKTASWEAASESWTEEEYLLDVTAQTGANAGLYHVTSHANSDWYLSRNNSNAYFAFYGNTQQYANIIFVPVDTRSLAPISWSAETGSATITNNGVNYSLPSLTNNSSLTVAYSSSDETIATIEDGTVTALAAGSTTISATYDGSAASAPYRTTTVSYTLTVTDATASYDFETVAELNALVTSTSKAYSGYLTNAIVSFIPQSNTAIVKDATGSVMFYKSGHGLKQGQTFTGPIEVTAVLYNGYSEVTAWNSTFTGSESTVEPQSVALSSLIGHFSDYQNAYVSIASLTVSSISDKNISVTDGTNTYIVYYNPSGTIPCEAGDIITAAGTVTKYQTTEELKVWSSSAITVTTPKPKVVTFSQPASGGSFTVSVGGNIITSGAAVASGTTVTLSATPANNYNFSSWRVYKTGDQNTAVTVSNNSFSMPAFSVSIEAVFIESGGKIYTVVTSGTNCSANVQNYTSSFSITNGGLTLNLQNFNNNNKGWDVVKAGAKKSKAADPDKVTTGTITTSEAITEAIRSVNVGLTLDRGSATAILYVASDSAFSNDLQTIDYGSVTGNVAFTVPTPAANRYYKIEFTCTNTTTTNGVISVSQVVYSTQSN